MKKTAIAALLALASCVKMNTQPTNKTTAQVNDELRLKKGNVLFWTSTPNRNLVVKVNGQERITSTSDLTEPACGANLHINEQLNVGNYAYTAYLIRYTQTVADTTTYTGKVDVVEGGCVKVKID